MTVTVHASERVAVSELREHPRNYRKHPDEQLEHLEASIREHGFYRNVVLARDGTILAGHGAVEAARRAGLTEITATRLDIDPFDVQALKILAADNMLPHFSEDNDRALADLLKEVSDIDDLLGTGFDASALAAFVMVTRPTHEIEDFDAAAEWVGMPDFEGAPPVYQLTISFDTVEERDSLLAQLGPNGTLKRGNGGRSRNWSMWWPPREKMDPRSVRWERP